MNPATFECHVQCYPWDLLDEGVDLVLDRLQGQLGINGITLVAAGNEVSQYRPRPGIEPKIYHGAGGVYFRPAPSCYQTTRLIPRAWEPPRRGDALAKISSACARRKMDLRLELSLFYSRRMVGDHPEAACKNAYGISSTGALCLSNPDVREYLRSVVLDLGCREGVSALVTNDVQWPAATDDGPFDSACAMFNSDLVDLLNVCFCESCLQGAAGDGIDGQEARRCVCELLEELVRTPAAETQAAEGAVASHEDLWRYIDRHELQLLTLLDLVGQASDKPLLFSFQGASAGLADLSYAPDLTRMADGLILDADGLEGIIGLLSDGPSWAGALTPSSVHQMELLLPLDEGLIEEAPELVRQASWAAQAGAGGLTISHYGAILEYQFDWIRQALRCARRLAQA